MEDPANEPYRTFPRSGNPKPFDGTKNLKPWVKGQSGNPKGRPKRKPASVEAENEKKATEARQIYLDRLLAHLKNNPDDKSISQAALKLIADTESRASDLLRLGIQIYEEETGDAGQLDLNKLTSEERAILLKALKRQDQDETGT